MLRTKVNRRIYNLARKFAKLVFKNLFTRELFVLLLGLVTVEIVYIVSHSKVACLLALGSLAVNIVCIIAYQTTEAINSNFNIKSGMARIIYLLVAGITLICMPIALLLIISATVVFIIALL